MPINIVTELDILMDYILVELYKKRTWIYETYVCWLFNLGFIKTTNSGFHYTAIHGQSAWNYNIVFSDTDRFVGSMIHAWIFEWIRYNREHLDLPVAVREGPRENTNKNSVGQFKDENH